ASLRVRSWFAAAFHLGRLIQAEPQDGRHYLRRGPALAHQGKSAEAKQDFEKALTLKDSLSEVEQATAHAEAGRWEDAATLYARAAEAPTASDQVWHVHALLRLQLGDRAGYAGACAALVKRFDSTKSAYVANAVAWTCALAPEALADLKPAVGLA